MIIELCIAVIAIAFVILVIYLIITMKVVRITLVQLNHTLIEGRKQLTELAIETKRVIRHGDQISIDIDEKINAFTPLFKTIKNLGKILEDNTSSFENALSKKVHSVISSQKDIFNSRRSLNENLNEKESITNSVKILEDVLKVTAIGIRLWQNIKKRR